MLREIDNLYIPIQSVNVIENQLLSEISIARMPHVLC